MSVRVCRTCRFMSMAASAAALGAEPDLVVADVVDHGERLLLRVPEDADGLVVAVGRERQARLRHLGQVQHPAKVEANGRVAGEHQRHRRDLHRPVPGEVVARVQDGQRGRLPVPAHVARERRPQRGVGAVGEPGDHRTLVDHRAGHREHGEGHLDRAAGDLDPGEVKVVERRSVAASQHVREQRVRRRGGAEGQVPREAARRRQAVGEARAVLGRRLRGQRDLENSELTLTTYQFAPPLPLSATAVAARTTKARARQLLAGAGDRAQRRVVMGLSSPEPSCVRSRANHPNDCILQQVSRARVPSAAWPKS
jgi:hypothetical protein